MVVTLHLVDERTLEAKVTNDEGDRVWTDRKMLPTCTRSRKILNVRKRPLVLAGAKNMIDGP